MILAERNIEEWQKILERDDLVGGEIETTEGGFAFRGPITSIKLEGNQIVVETAWTAKLETTVWQICEEKHEFVIDADHSTPHEIGGGRIHFQMEAVKYGTIFPKGGSKLHPSRIMGS